MKVRSQEEIAKDCRKEAFFPFRKEVLLPYLDFEHAREFLNDGVTAAEWDEVKSVLDRETVLKEMADYMEFAWGKVEDHRGISASRSVTKMEAWIFLLGDDAMLGKLSRTPYAQYGAPKLKAVCDEYGFLVPTVEGIQNMIEGKPCRIDCQEGCDT